MITNRPHGTYGGGKEILCEARKGFRTESTSTENAKSFDLRCFLINGNSFPNAISGHEHIGAILTPDESTAEFDYP